MHFGHDRNGVSFPIKFISWGSGQDVLYAYMLLPLIAAAGLSPMTVRLPMLVLALATLPLAYLATKRIFGAGVRVGGHLHVGDLPLAHIALALGT